MSELKLIALDEVDLGVVSAHLQDAVVKVGDLVHDPKAGKFIAAVNRFAWERKPVWFTRRYERRRAVLHFDRVRAVSALGVDRARPRDVLSLLAIRFEPGEAPAGTIELAFSGGATIRLDVECIEARLADMGAAWDTPSRPVHRV